MNIKPIRTFDAERLNAILNHSEVRRWVADGTKPLDMSNMVRDERNVVLMGEHGAGVFGYLQPGIYELHSQVLPEGRGPWVDAFGRECLKWIFANTAAFEVVTRVPKGYLAAKTLALRHGFRLEFTRHGECALHGQMLDVSIYSLSIANWVHACPDLEDIGRRFHAVLHEAADDAGITEPAHADDPNHNSYVGATVLMGLGGQILKALLWYNRWAALSRHPLIRLVSKDPPVAEIDHGLRVKFVEGRLEIDHASRVGQ